MQRIIAMFNRMNWQIPVYGAILINQTCDKVLLVQTLVSNAKGGAWMFPRGKMEKRDHGTSFDCACREVRSLCLDIVCEPWHVVQQRKPCKLQAPVQVVGLCMQRGYHRQLEYVVTRYHECERNK